MIEAPAGLFAFGFDTDFRAAFMLEEVQSQVSYHHQVAVGVSRFQSAAILVKATSRTQCRPFSMLQRLLVAASNVAASAG